MEAPEKIYIFENPILDFTKLSVKQNDNDIEYTRTNAFIEKACLWLKESITNNPECNRIISKKGVITMGELIKDFKKYMEGEEV
jgi:hypothetical protein